LALGARGAVDMIVIALVFVAALVMIVIAFVNNRRS
jgi:hypothetical protein